MSTAIRNVGELASPYYLLEVWARREEIDIDPETYASLKQKARRLVRDARAFESRGADPDDQWHASRRELVGLNGAPTREVVLEDGSTEPVIIWKGPRGSDDLVVGDLPGLMDADERSPDANDPPSTRFELALDRCEVDAEWGLLLAGLELRVYRRSTGVSQQYLGLDLADLVELDDEPQWKAFAAIFRVPAFAREEEAPPLIRRVVDESRRHATRIADDMRADVVEAAEALIQGALDHPGNRDALGHPSRAGLQQLFEETLYVLYRLLFLLYAESRDVLPLSGGGAYATTYSVDHLVERARREAEGKEGTYYQDSLERLFRLLGGGPAEGAHRLGIEPVGGELFDPARVPLLSKCRIDDTAWRRCLLALALGAEGSARRKLGRRSSFADLGVDQLGSIYEGLLVMEPHLAPGRRLLVLLDKERRVVDPGSEGKGRLIRELHAGSFALESASGRRKGSGSFYTPHEITEYLTRAAIDPLVEPILSRAREDPSGSEQAMLQLRVCDPAMGSGAFLVQAARVLGLALARVRAARGDGRVTPEMIHQAKRDVVRHCLYGVDLNPLAVVLAKVSLWLETLERGKPLSFLDARLRCGDSLVGLTFSGSLRDAAGELAAWPREATGGLRKYLQSEAGEMGAAVLSALSERKGRVSAKDQILIPGFGPAVIEEELDRIAAEREKLADPEVDETLQIEMEVERKFRELEAARDSVRNRLRAAADFWCAQWFWEGEDAPRDRGGPVIPPNLADYEDVAAALLRGDDVPVRLRPAAEAASAIARRRLFFHWGLEFPEVIVERGGFDAVLGNPPWNTLSPDRNEFFGTYDPLGFLKGVAKEKKKARAGELRADEGIDSAWRREARFLHELSHYVKPDSGQFRWFAPTGNLRKGDANVFRLFVERAYTLLRDGGHLAQVLPDSVYISAPATGVRQRLLTEGVLERCFVFENRREIFPIHRSVKVVLLTAKRGGGPTERFRAAFLVGKDAAGRERAVGLEELPRVLADLDREAPELTMEQVQALGPETWSFPELQTALDAEIVAQVAAAFPPLNLDDRGWGLTYCAELHSDRDSALFIEAAALEAMGARRDGLRWYGPGDEEWWPLVEGTLFYHLEFPAEGKDVQRWVGMKGLEQREKEVTVGGGRAVRSVASIARHYRLAWRAIASSTNERSVVAAVLPPRCAAKDSCFTVMGGTVASADCLVLAAVFSSFCFDYVVRFGGKTNLKYAAMNPTPTPPKGVLRNVLVPAAEVVCQGPDCQALWAELRGAEPLPVLDHWGVAERRAKLDALIAGAYSLSGSQFLAVLSAFPNVDRSQPMLPGEPKSFVTRDLALLAYCREYGGEVPDVGILLRDAGVHLPDPRPEYRGLEARVDAAKALGAVPYRPTPKGGRTPTDPALLDAVREALAADPRTASDVAELLDEDEKTITQVLKGLVRENEAYAEGRGRSRRYYVVED